MKQRSILLLILAACMLYVLSGGSLAIVAEHSFSAGRLSIPKTWDDAAMTTIELPLADRRGSPKHISADYYYRIPIRPIYKQYPVFAPGHEPPGYLDWLRDQEPAIVWDGRGHAPPLVTEEDWIRAGEIVFDAPVTFLTRRLLSIRASCLRSRTCTAAVGTARATCRWPQTGACPFSIT